MSFFQTYLKFFIFIVPVMLVAGYVLWRPSSSLLSGQVEVDHTTSQLLPSLNRIESILLKQAQQLTELQSIQKSSPSSPQSKAETVKPQPKEKAKGYSPTRHPPKTNKLANVSHPFLVHRSRSCREKDSCAGGWGGQHNGTCPFYRERTRDGRCVHEVIAAYNAKFKNDWPGKIAFMVRTEPHGLGNSCYPLWQGLSASTATLFFVVNIAVNSTTTDL